jgi:hypothetical protein
MNRLIVLCMISIAACVLVSTAAACCCVEPLTQGYWKTHSIYGPAPYDDAWANLEDTKFCGSDLTCFEVLTTPPAGGNAYYILAHQWIAAGLNSLNGVIMPDSVYQTYWDAKPLLSAYADDMEIPKGSDRELAIEYATILEKFNSGE